MQMKIRHKWKTALIAGLAFLLLVLAGLAVWSYRLLYAPSFKNDKTVYVYIDRQTDFDALCRQLSDSAHCRDLTGFKLLAHKSKYPAQMHTGRYAVTPGMSDLALLRRLRSGEQAPVRLTFNNIRLLDELAGRLSEQLMLSKEDLTTRFNDPKTCADLGFNPQTLPAMFIPNTYEVYWDISPDQLLRRMKHEFDAFWTPARRMQAKAVGLDPVGIATLASIIEEESAAVDEYPLIAGLYLNRLRLGIPLQSDPTVKFAVGDFSLRRILAVHLRVDSPYNTYMYAGLPPGPIRIPSIRAIEAVLNYQPSHYLYMCAKEDFSGRHNFATTLAEHQRNAERYHAALNRLHIR
ncbi:MAG: endolytic transglycosylase MltG [Tannerella sp.]|jgi:UPF0755 protein|nr:endolytic transglycosylase MltG [Tannerella sp.]